MGLFDSPWHVLILLVVVLLLFGAKRLPGSARSLGQALRIFKAETQGLRSDGDNTAQPGPSPAAAQQLPPVAPGGTTVNGAPVPEAQRTNQPG